MKDSRMKHLLFLTPLLLWVGSAQAQPLTSYDTQFRLNRGFDSWTVDSAYAVVFDGSIAADTGLRVSYDTSRWAGRPDTLTFTVSVSATTISKTVNPSVMMCWWLSDGRFLCDEKLIAHMVHSVDTARYASATASVDWVVGSDTIDQVLTAAHGSGAWTSAGGGSGGDTVIMHVLNSADSTPVGGVPVWMYPNGGGVALSTTSDANGIAYFGYSAPDTFLAYAWVTGWNPDSIPFYVYASAALADSMYLTQVTAASPASPSLTSLTFNFKTMLGDSIKNVDLQYRLYTKSAQVYHMDSTKVLDYTTVYSARTAASGQVTVNVIPNDSLLVEGNRTGQTWWMFQAYHPETGLPLLGKDGLKLKVPASAVGLTWPTDAALLSE